MLELRDVHTYYGNSQVLRGVNLRVPPGAIVALLGRNGMGKSTTVHSVIGFAPPRSGSITLRGKELRGLAPSHIARHGVALVPQGRRVFPSLTVRENLRLAARGGDRPGGWTLERVYEAFPRLKEREHYPGTLLSGGEQQMLALGRALMTNPDVLLVDEPSEGLAPLIVQAIGDILRQLRADGLSILLVEQNLPLALSVADDVYILSKGVVVHECAPDELRRDEAIKSRYLGASG